LYANEAWAYQVPHFPPRPHHFWWEKRFIPPSAVPCSLALTGSSSQKLRPSTESFRPVARLERYVRSAFLGVAIPLGDLSFARPYVEHPKPAALPPSAFLTPSAVSSAPSLAGLFHPAATSRVHSSGVFPRTQPIYLVGKSCPLVVGQGSLLAVAHQRRSPWPRPQGFTPCPSPLPFSRCLAERNARSPPELILLQVLSLAT